MRRCFRTTCTIGGSTGHQSMRAVQGAGVMPDPPANFGSYMAECHAFSQELLFVLWWCR